MKKLKYIYFILLFIPLIKVYSQGCGSASPFCSGSTSYTFPASTGGTSAPVGPNYGCLFSQPNPAWYYFQVSTSGSIDINIAGTGGGDVDFICWGPFTSATGGCGNLTAANTIDCSFSASPTETCNIASAVAGEYYMLLITNFSGMSQNISFGQSPGSTGSTNCGLLSSGVSSKTICPTATASLTASSNLTSPTYSWSPGGATTSSILVSPSATTIYTVTINGINPSTSTPTVIVNTGTVTVLSLPTLTVTSANLICPNSSINIFASPGFTSYVWAGPPAFTSTTTISGISLSNATASMLGTYTVTGKTAQGCQVINTTTVGFIPTPNITTTPTYTVCQGGTQIFTNTNAVGANYYSWSGPSSFISSAQNPTISLINLNQSGTYTVTAYFVVGTNTCVNTNTCNIVVVPGSPAALTNIPAICNNGTINLLAPTGGTSYNWTGPNSFTAAVQNPVLINANTINNGTYTVIITTGLCVNVGTVAVNVYNPVSFNTVPNNMTLCFGKSGLLHASGNGGSGVYNYSWSPITDLTSPNSGTTSVIGNTTTTYSVTLSDANCPITANAVYPVTVTVNPTPVISMFSSKDRGCEVFCTDINATSVPTSTNCQWRFSNNLAYGGCNNPNFCFPTHGVYGATLTVTDVNGCVDSLKNNAFITVDPNPIADFNWSPNNPTVLINEVSFSDQSSVGLPFNSWHWNFGDTFGPLSNDTSNIQNPSHIYDNPFSYSVSLTVVNSFGCRDSVMKIVKVEDEFSIFIPNSFSPSKIDGVNDVFKITGIGYVTDDFELKIYDRLGELVFKTNDITKGWDGSVKGSKIAATNVYVYKIEIKDYRLKLREFVGHISVL